MKVVVIGGGTAGHMAAAMVTRHFPGVDLYHVYDPTLPIIGVGESTLVHFPPWLHEVTGLSEEQIRERCGITRKYGISFENWGPVHERFLHHFTPPDKAYGYHLSAPDIVELLHDFVSATRLEKRAERVESDGHHVDIRFQDGSSLLADFVFDARGFPPMNDKDVCPLPIVPTNAAHILQGPPVSGQTTTRAVARPHGWIFIIPLTLRTAYGYIYNADISSRDEVHTDLLDFFGEDGVRPLNVVQDIRFPNFTRRTFFDGALYTMGNRAQFLEPLESTGIGIAFSQLEAARLWLLDGWRSLPIREETRTRNIDKINRYFFRYVLKAAVFVGWHYSMGSAFQSPFWDYAVANYWRELEKLGDSTIVEEFDEHLARVRPFESRTKYSAHRRERRAGEAALPAPALFGGWPPESLIDMYNGLACRGRGDGSRPGSVGA
jgi:tryptophan halogenase